ncbi:MAG: hypothetical protein CBB68_14510 [Rhodospirillaceae bacterium TMED8]|nr:hypothetical protein [Magnetovibrio sp.]OUT47938.1 MAG: hypothetical protein CBB68_14510 [Rhodospirillaceae bacterium TMED8]|tara:strand:+ start:7942 stop:8763 length:822 start_codon:yes stop_codon:yes gene_type:complete
MHIRNKLAPALLACLQLFRGIAGPPSGVRIPIFHHTPLIHLPLLEELTVRLRDNNVLASPANIDSVRQRQTTSYILSFDDGFASNFEAAKLLKNLGVSAIFFICPGIIDMRGAAQRKAMSKAFFGGCDAPDSCQLLNWNEIEKIRSMGHVIGAHGMNHVRLSTLTGQHLVDEIIGANHALKMRLGDKADWYAFSYGDIKSISRAALKCIRQTYRYCRSGVRGINDTAINPFALRGEEIQLDAPIAYQKLILEGGLDVYYSLARKHLDAMVRSE